LGLAYVQSEVEETLKRISSHKGVHGILIVNVEGVPIRSTLDPSLTTTYAAHITAIAAKARSVIRDLDPTVPHPPSFISRQHYTATHPIFCPSAPFCVRGTLGHAGNGRSADWGEWCIVHGGVR
jgi:hypothetical protein